MIRFSRFIFLYFLISAIVIVPGILSLIFFGFKPAVDFTGGTLLEIHVEPSLTQSMIEEKAAANTIELSGIQKGGENSFFLRMKPTEDAKLASFSASLNKESSTAAAIVREESVGPVLGRELLEKAITAAVVAILVIFAYVAYAFKDIKYGVSAVIALVHDLLVVLGTFSLLGHFAGVEVDTLFVTAFLTTMSFSVHDTIVVFDRIRENTRKGTKLSFEEICDMALTETMGRSLTNSLTIIFMLLALVLLGGTTTRWFVVALLIGTISGTYSSPFVATPLLILWDRWERKRAKR